MPRLVRTPKVVSTDEAQKGDLGVVRQIDELQEISEKERNKILGSGFLDEAAQFFNLTVGSQVSPSFRPKVMIPQLQVLFMNEATDLSDPAPKIFVLNKGKREQPRERAFQEYWRQNYFNNRILMAHLWSMLAGTAFIQAGYDANGKRGKGEIWIQERDPRSVYPDPAVADPDRWAYVIIEDKMYIDEVRMAWPDRGYAVRPRHGPKPQVGEEGGFGLMLPPGPMSVQGGTPGARGTLDARVRVRHVFTKDYTREEIKKEEKQRIQETLGPLVPAPKYKMKWPNGRWIVECEGIILADGSNPFPFGWFPVVPFHSIPPVGSVWSPPPMKYTRPLQELAQRMLTQIFENNVRLNNGIWFIDENTGISADDFGGIPAEVRVINANSRIPEVRWPTSMPKHMVDLPLLLLQLQKELQGFTPSRAGQPGAGNISANLYDASVFQAQYLTRLRARLAAESIQKVAELVFYTMLRYYRDGTVFYGFGDDGQGPQPVEWKQAGSPDDYDVFLEPGSIRPMSSSALRQITMMLLDKGHIPLRYALEMLDIPGAAQIAEEQRETMELAALGRLRRPR